MDNSQKALLLRILRYLLVAALIAASIVFFTKKTDSKKSFEEVKSAVTTKINTENMVESADRFLMKHYGLNASDFDGVVYYAPITNMHAEELLLIKLKDSYAAETIKEIIEKRRDSQIAIFEGYAPEKTAQLEQSVIDIQGNFILYVVADNAEEIDKIFRESI